MGLLLSHKRTKVSVYSDMVTFSHPGEAVCKPGKRGEVEVMSRASRKRLLMTMHKMIYTSVTMITLTYPKIFPMDGRKLKAQLKEFRRRFEKKWGKLRAFWRLEFQDRGAPHFHILYFDCPFLPIPEVSVIWYAIVKSGDPNHLKCGVDLKRIHEETGRAQIMYYVSKYIAKFQREGESGKVDRIGRYWGKWNIAEETPITFDIAHGLAGLIANRIICDRGSDDSWIPASLDSCSIFGNSMGSSKFGEYVTSVIREAGIT